MAGASHAEALVNLAELLRADDDDAVCGEACQRALDREEEARLPATVVAVKDVSVVGVHHAAAARSAPQSGRREPAIKKTGHASHGARLRRVRVDDVGPLAPNQTA